MIRMLLALLVLLGTIYLIFQMTTGGESDEPLEAQKDAVEKAEQAKETAEQHTDNLKKQVERDIGKTKDDDDPG